jgi:oligoendopeptidase F
MGQSPNLMNNSLYNKFKEEGESFKPKFLKLISYGGSRSPEYMLSEMGIDIRSRDFWQSGFNIIDGMVNELERYV